MCNGNCTTSARFFTGETNTASKTTMLDIISVSSSHTFVKKVEAILPSSAVLFLYSGSVDGGGIAMNFNFIWLRYTLLVALYYTRM